MNIATFVVLMLVAAGVVLVVRSLLRDKKSGKRSCGGDCSKCRGCH